MSAAESGPWWVMSFFWAERRVTIKFKTTEDGYPGTVRLIEVESVRGDVFSPFSLACAMREAAKAYCAAHRDDIVAAWSAARGAPAGVYAPEAAA